MPAPPRRLLIVNADDYGLTAGVSAGIRHAHHFGLVRSTTAMVNRPHIRENLRIAQDECPDMGIGVHLTLTMGKPLLGRHVPSLRGADGAFPRLKDWSPQRWDHVDSEELTAEWRAQTRFLAECLGRAPSHADSHHHVACLHPKATQALKTIAAEFDMPIRNPVGCAAEIDIFGEGVAGAPKDWSDLRRPDFMISALPEDRTAQALIRALPQGGAAEIMCHPGHIDSELRSLSSYTDRREWELAVLIRPELRAGLIRAGITLGDFRDL